MSRGVSDINYSAILYERMFLEAIEPTDNYKNMEKFIALYTRGYIVIYSFQKLS